MAIKRKSAMSFVFALALSAVALMTTGCDPVRDGFRAGVQDGVKSFISDFIGLLTTPQG